MHNFSPDEGSVEVLSGRAISVTVDPKLTELPAVKAGSLTVEEEARFQTCHRTVIDYQLSALKAAVALAEIRDQKLYRDHFRTFAEYCQWFRGWGKSYAYDLLAFGEIVTDLSANAENYPLPLYEAQTRPLRLVDANDRSMVWKLALQTGNETPSMKTVVDARERFWTTNPSRRPKRVKEKSASQPALVTKLHMDPENLAFLREHSKEKGIPVDQLVSTIVERELAKLREKSKKTTAVRGSEPEPDLFGLGA